MTREKLKQIAFERLEEIIGSDSEEDLIMSICMGENYPGEDYPGEDCKRIGILLKRKIYWMHEKENEELYGRAISHYHELVEQGKGGLSHGYCPICFENRMKEFSSDEIKKARELLQ